MLPRPTAEEFTTTRVTRSDVALRFAGAAMLVALVAGGLAYLLMRWFPPTAFPELSFPPLFAVSTLLLLLGSVSLSRAIAAVRRERQVLDLVVAGRLNKQIASDLGTVEKTIKVHRGRVMDKMRARTVVDLVRTVQRFQH